MPARKLPLLLIDCSDAPAPEYKWMAKEFKGRAVFLKVDVNRNYETSSAAGVRAMATFSFFIGW